MNAPPLFLSLALCPLTASHSIFPLSPCCAQDSVFPEALTPLKEADPEVYALVQKEKLRQMYASCRALSPGPQSQRDSWRVYFNFRARGSTIRGTEAWPRRDLPSEGSLGMTVSWAHVWPAAPGSVAPGRAFSRAIVF